MKQFLKFAAFCILVVDKMQDAVTGLTHKKEAFVYGVAKVTLLVLAFFSARIQKPFM